MYNNKENNNMCKVTVVSIKQRKSFAVQKGEKLLKALHTNNIYIDAPCGGLGICGKCKVKIVEGKVSPPESGELKKLSEKDLTENYRFACMTKILGDLTVEINAEIDIESTIPGYMDFSTGVSPLIDKSFFLLGKPSLDNQKDDVKRLKDALTDKNKKLNISFDILGKISKVMREKDFKVTVISDDENLYEIEAGDTRNRSYGVAVDIGTTTVVVYLIDLFKGRQVDVISQMNSQKSLGADVISRINHIINQQDGLDTLQKMIISQVDDMILAIAKKNNVNTEEIIGVVMVGNTTMQHIATGLSPVNIASSPFIPVITDKITCKSSDIGFTFNNSSVIYFLPCVSGYVGSDIVSAILASRMYEDNKLSLLVDIGTNGEIALGSKDGIVSCSTAAGPAFEGAQIKHGIGGVPGAINSVKLINDDLKYTTISDKKPIGICGSGVVDTIALLIETGIVDETGRIIDKEELENDLGVKLYKRVVEVDEGLAFILAYARETQDNNPIVITGKDIREIQLAKAAIAAGIKTLIKKMDTTAENINTVYLAGGFGSYIDKISAIKIGLFPSEFKNKIKVLGNAAGTGAIMSLMFKEKYKDCDLIKNKVKYIELSSSPEFTDEYVNSMYFNL